MERHTLLWIYYGSLVQSLNSTRCLETATALCRLGWQVTLAATEIPSDRADEQLTLIRLPKPRFYLVGYLTFHIVLLFQLILKRNRASVILFNQHSAPFLLPLAICRRILLKDRPKIVMDVRSVPMIIDSRRNRRWSLVFAFVQRAANRLADGQTAITQRAAEAVGIPEGQLLGIWPSGVNVEQFETAMLKRLSPAERDPLRLIYIGSLHHDRGLPELCEAVQMVRSEGLNVTLAFAGAGPQKGVLEKYAREWGDGAITVKPPVPHHQVPSLLADADIGILPFPDLLKYQISSPIKLFEYMAAGLPILATRVACHVDVIRGDYVFWAEDSAPSSLADAIRKAYAHKSELSQMGCEAARAAKSWTWEKSGQRLSAALESVLDRSSLPITR